MLRPAQRTAGQLRVWDQMWNDDFVRSYRAFQRWGDETLPPKTRSMLNLTMIAALNRMHEWELHFRGAIKNGLTRDELKQILLQIAIYCGVPVGVECFRIAKKVWAELDAEGG